MQQVLDTNPSAIYVRDGEEQFVFSNRAMAQLAGNRHTNPRAPDEAARDAARYATGDDLVLATGQEITSEDRLSLATGEKRWFHSVKRPLLRPDGSVHVLGVLNDVLDMAKISAGKLELEAVTFNLSDSISEALAPLEVQAREKSLNFQLQAMRDIYPQPWVVGDAHRLKQVLLNLLSNAIKFPAAGSVSVSSSVLDETTGMLSLRFCVSDTGPGIEASKQALIFESFTQANADTARHHGGTGLGLSISRALVAQMGEQLRLASTTGQGSCFDFELSFPKAPAPTVADASGAVYNTGRLAGTRVLLVEDNEINRTVARMMLETWGVELDEAEDGAIALARLAEASYDLMLTDIQMPGLSGLDVTRHLRIRLAPGRHAYHCPHGQCLPGRY